MLIAQISDTHVLADGRLFRSLIDPAKRVRQAVDALNRLERKVAALILTGDLTDGGRREEYLALRHALDEALDYPVYLLPGNRDVAPTMRDVFDQHRYFASDTRCHWSVAHEGVRIVGLDTSVADAAHGELDEDQLAWLDRTLAADSRPTLLALHHPPLPTHLGMMDRWGLAGTVGFDECIRRHRHVRLLTCGHLHRGMAAEFAGVRLNVCPSTAFTIAPDLYQPNRLTWVDEGGHFQIHDCSAGGMLTWTLSCNSPAPRSFVDGG